MTLSVRLNEKTRRRLSRAARDRRVSQSEIVRQAIDAFLDSGAASEGVSVYDKMKHLIGSVNGGPPDLSERHSEYFYEYLLDKKRKGRL